MSEIIIPQRNELFEARLHGDSEGWHFGAGDPESWKFSKELLKPGGTLLDLGIGDGRGSLFFALHGMHVVGIDNDGERLESLQQLANDLREVIPGSFGLAIEDLIGIDLPRDTFDTVLIGSLIHLPSREEVLGLIEKAYGALKSGGHIWVRAVSKEDSLYEEMRGMSTYDDDYIVRDSGHVIDHPCTCSGEYRIDPTVFLDPFDIHTVLGKKGANLIHSQTIPVKGKNNIMFGEDFNKGHRRPHQTSGAVTIIATKP